ncbi:hypothetical protein GCM10010976_09810 [Bizionia arctica]|uniref:Type II toxin-antitoxin system RelE/ParE family toxin n=1 Tax=Bizionia arctica TaxID=1495645 RepID=A0A917GDH2_9FLAO|nr:hypothetical protein GCM10010976_09810 [Bizionia arctica]
MVVNYEISNEADLELHKALCYLKLFDKEDEFKDDLLDQLRVICSMPKAFQVRYKKVRIVNLEKFHYSIHYSIFKDKIIILRIINQNQDF